MNHTAQGTFDVSLAPSSEADNGEGSALGTLTLVKRYHGPLDAESRGQMLTASSNDVKGSAAYVAVERLTGTLDGRTGSFALVHRGIMSAAGRELRIDVVPDSGSGELKGIAGTLEIAIASDGAHNYTLTYTLPGGDVH